MIDSNQHAGSATAADELLNIRETCKLLGITPRTMHDWRRAKAIRCIQRPGFVRFRRSDIEAFLRAHERCAATDKPRRQRRKNGEVH